VVYLKVFKGHLKSPDGQKMTAGPALATPDLEQSN